MKHQITDAAASLLLPPQILEGVPFVPVFSGSYTTWDLYSYLGLLQQKLKDCKNPVSLRLIPASNEDKEKFNAKTLSKAIGCGNLELVKILLEAGVDPD
ncbi:ankyrin repeat domain-containing protein [Legionella sp. WA2024007413]